MNMSKEIIPVETLQEKVSAIVYHASSINNSAKILKGRKFILSSAIEAETETLLIPGKIKTKKSFYMSTFRSVGASYHRAWTSGAIFVLDGDYINARYSGRSINFWNPEGGKYSNEGDVGGKGTELEDRIFSAEPFIEFPDRATDMIKEIHILVPKKSKLDDYPDHIQMKFNARNLYRDALKLRIPVFLYQAKPVSGTNKAWLLMNKSKAVAFKFTALDDLPASPTKDHYDANLLKTKQQDWLVPFGTKAKMWGSLSDKVIQDMVAGKKSPKEVSISGVYDHFFEYRDLHTSNNTKSLGDRAAAWVKNISYDGTNKISSVGVLARGLRDTMEASNRQPSEELKKSLMALLRIWRILKVNTATDYALAMYDKWFRILEMERFVGPQKVVVANQVPQTVNKRLHGFRQKMAVNESFDSAYPFRAIDRVGAAVTYGFESVHGGKYQVYIAKTIKEGEYYVSFGKLDEKSHQKNDWKAGATGDNKDPSKIFATVIAIMTKFMAENEVNSFQYSADSDEPSRVKLYDTMTKFFARKMGMTHKMKKSDLGTTYTLMKKSKIKALKEEFLSEKVSGIVYHATMPENAVKILKEKRFSLSSATGSEKEIDFVPGADKTRKTFYMSTTRSITGRYHKNWDSGVIFVLDGDYLNRRHRGQSVDYWWYPGKTGQTAKGNELEDRVYSDKPWIDMPEKATDMVKEIHIQVVVREYKWAVQSDIFHQKKVIELYRLAKLAGIPVYIYTTDGQSQNQAWVLLDKRRAVTLKDSGILDLIGDNGEGDGEPDAEKSDWLIPMGKRPSHYDREGRRMMGRAIKAGARNLRGLETFNALEPYMELYHAKSFDALSNEARNKVLSIMQRPSSYNDLYQDMSDIRISSKAIDKAAISKMLRIFREMKVQSPGEFMAAMADKWKKINSESVKESVGPLTVEVYHGSNSVFAAFSQKMKRIPNDYYGGGIAYFTDDKKIGLKYAKAMKQRYGGSEYLYVANVSLFKVFDVDHIFTGEELKAFWPHIKAEVFARGAGLLKAGVDKYEVLAKLENGSISVSGQDAFRGLSQGMVQSSLAEKILMALGYDGLRYNGGDNMGMVRHNVYIPYYPEKIKIVKRFKINRELVTEDVEMPPIGYMTFSRDLLPQITDQDEFLSHLNSIGIDHAWKSVPWDALKATQLDGFDMKKVKAMMKRPSDKPILVSGDNFILDGHHRWIAAFNKKENIDCIAFDVPILELIRIAADFYNSEHADIILDESFNAGKDVLYHHLGYAKARSTFEDNNLVANWDHEIPNLHVNASDGPKRYDGTGSKTVHGTSLTRNLHLNYNAEKKQVILELDKTRLRMNKKLHVIDADLVANRVSPHDTYFDTYTISRLSAYRWATTPAAKRNSWTGVNEFAEEFLEGDLPDLHRYLKCIWLKRPDNLSNNLNLISFHDTLALYAARFAIPVKYYPSGKDALDDLMDLAAAEIEAQKILKTPSKNKADHSKMTRVIAGIRKSINRTENRV